MKNSACSAKRTVLREFRELGLQDLQAGMEREWSLSEETFDPFPFFLKPRFLESAMLKSGINPSEHAPILKVASVIRQNRALVRLMWHQHHLMFVSDSGKRLDDVALPERIDLLGDEVYTYNLLLAFSGFPKAEELLKRFPQDVLKGVYKDVGIWCAHFRRSKNLCGISLRILKWEHSLIHGAFYRIGRLQFNIRPFHPNYHVFRNRQTGLVQALIKGGVILNTDGQIDGVDGIHDPQAWNSRFDSDSSTVSGHRLSPRGFVSKEVATLKRSEWENVLSPGDPVLDVHIPAGEPLRRESCSDAFCQACAFFKDYFPEKPFKGFACQAWFLDVQLAKLLPPTSNILAFQRELYLYPTRQGEAESLHRIFGNNEMKGGLSHLPRTNSLQRSVAAFLEKGGRLRAGGGFYLIEDLPFGRTVYREMTPCN